MRQISCLAGVLVEGAYVVSEPLLLVAEVLRHLAGGRKLDVHVVGGAAHHPLGGIGDYLQGATSADEVVVGLGDDVGEGDGLAAAGRREGHVLGQFRLVLQVVDAAQGAGGAGQLGVGGNVGYTFALEPNLAVVLEAVEELGTGTHGHQDTSEKGGIAGSDVSMAWVARQGTGGGTMAARP